MVEDKEKNLFIANSRAIFMGRRIAGKNYPNYMSIASYRWMEPVPYPGGNRQDYHLLIDDVGLRIVIGDEIIARSRRLERWSLIY